MARMNGSAFRVRPSSLQPMELPIMVEREGAYVSALLHELTDDDLRLIAAKSDPLDGWEWCRDLARILAGYPPQRFDARDLSIAQRDQRDREAAKREREAAERDAKRPPGALSERDGYTRE